MSGTSLDGVDGVLARISDEGRTQVMAHAACGFTPELRQSLLTLNATGEDELHRAALAARGLTEVYRDVVHQLLKMSAHSPSEIVAIGAHGQTIRHQPTGPRGYTWQLNQPALLAEWTGIDVVADFAAGMSPQAVKALRWCRPFTSVLLAMRIAASPCSTSVAFPT